MTFRMEEALDVTQPLPHLQTRRPRPRSGAPAPNLQFILCGVARGHHPLGVSTHTHAHAHTRAHTRADWAFQPLGGVWMESYPPTPVCPVVSPEAIPLSNITPPWGTS